jgi:hypothetical protein
MLKQGLARCKVLAPLLAAEAMDSQAISAARNGGLPKRYAQRRRPLASRIDYQTEYS